MVELLASYDVLGAFRMTIQLTFCAAIGSLLIGTILAVMRVSPVGVLRGLGGVLRQRRAEHPADPHPALLRAGRLYVLQIPLAPTDSPTSVRDNAIRWAIVGLSVYHAAFVCEALRSGVNTVDRGQAEAARAIGLTFAQSMREVIMPQAFRGAIAPLGSVLIALTKNTTVASVIGVAEASLLMKTIIENETASVTVFLVFAIGFVILTLPVGVFFTSLSRRLAVKR